ncbi:MAG TPA: prepilin-type N-terminal cleavage/methylation domain-containing protein [Candidatus Saccharimonadales bacterium]|nr:prepilin-type N-terminal cleavage/methylation domain-containing protein [Candidatus Saccharimonadales bacterium]
MFKKLQKRNSEGFTIIEVMIVLAIAALILLIVLLAVPALQRNSRNTTIKNDAASVAGAINTYESDNNGATPSSISSTNGKVTIANGTCASPGTTAETVNVNGSTAVVCNTTPTAGLKIGADIGTDTTIPTSTIQVQTGHSCPDNGNAVSTAPASARSVALYYLTETSGGKTLQCTTS